MDIVQTVVVGVIFISLLVVIHEFGHYATARLFKVRVSEFMVGLPGPHVYLFKKGGTAFGLTSYPFGGYARIAGMEPGPEDPLLACALAYVYRQGTTDAEHLSWYLSTRGLTALPSTLGEEGASDPRDRAQDLLLTLESWASIVVDESKEAKRAERLAKQEDRIFWPRFCAPEDAARCAALGAPREVDDEKALLDEQRKGTYHALSVPKRLLVLFAGPAMNLLTAIVILVLVLCIVGVSTGTTTLLDVVAGGPAQEAGMQAGDIVTSLAGTETPTYSDFSAALLSCSPGDTVEVTWTRDGQEMTALVTLGDNDGFAQLGVYVQAGTYHLGIGQAFSYTMYYIGQVALAIVSLFNPLHAQEVLSQSSSVVGIAVIAKESLSAGAVSFGTIVAAISISLGLMNLLPIPPLDGGKILIELVQVVSRREVSIKAQNAVSIAGMVFFGFLFVYTLVQDVGRIATGFYG